jgi:hypothetical protein
MRVVDHVERYGAELLFYFHGRASSFVTQRRPFLGIAGGQGAAGQNPATKCREPAEKTAQSE